MKATFKYDVILYKKPEFKLVCTEHFAMSQLSFIFQKLKPFVIYFAVLAVVLAIFFIQPLLPAGSLRQ